MSTENPSEIYVLTCQTLHSDLVVGAFDSHEKMSACMREAVAKYQSPTGRIEFSVRRVELNFGCLLDIEYALKREGQMPQTLDDLEIFVRRQSDVMNDFKREQEKARTEFEALVDASSEAVRERVRFASASWREVNDLMKSE